MDTQLVLAIQSAFLALPPQVLAPTFLEAVSDLTHPNAGFKFYPALLFVLYRGDSLYGYIALLVYISAEALNFSLKIALRGDRPYWTSPEAVQFPGLTCETSYGMPSGHAMVTGTLFYTIVGPWLHVPSLVLHLGMLLAALARVFVAAHFVSQVMAGWVCAGILSWGWRTTLLPWVKWAFPRHPLIVWSVSCIAVGIILTVPLLIFPEPSASLDLAMSGCHRGASDIARTAASAYLAVYRISGILAALGVLSLSVHNAKRAKAPAEKGMTKQRLSTDVWSLLSVAVYYCLVTWVLVPYAIDTLLFPSPEGVMGRELLAAFCYSLGAMPIYAVESPVYAVKRSQYISRRIFR